MTTTQRWTLLATALGLFMIFLDALIVNVALPDVQTEFDVGENGLQWVVGAYAIGMAALMMTSATLADRLGRRRVYLGGVIVFSASSIVCGLAPSIEVLSLARGVQGLAAAAVNVASLALVSQAFPDPDEKARAIGIWTAIGASALALGPSLGGVLTDVAGWRSVFLVNVPIGAAAVVLIWTFVVESRNPGREGLDPVGQILYFTAISGFSWMVIQGPRTGWSSAPIVAAGVVFVVGFIAFIWWELSVAQPMMEVRLFANRVYRLVILVIFAVLFCFYGTMLVLTQLWQTVRGFSPLITGLLLAPAAFGQMFLAPRVGSWMSRWGGRRLLLTGLTILPAGLAITIVGAQTLRGLPVLGVGALGIALAFTMPPATTIAMESVADERSGMASGIMSAQRAIGSMAGYAVLGTILAGWLGATVNADLAVAIPDRRERDAIAERIVDAANPHAFTAEIGPGRPVPTASSATRREVADAATEAFVRGIQLALGAALFLSLVTLILVARQLPDDAPLVHADDARAPPARA